MMFSTPTALLLTTLFLFSIVNTVLAAANQSQIIDLGIVTRENSRALHFFPELGAAPFDVVFVDPELNLVFEESVKGPPNEKLVERAEGTYSLDHILLWQANRMGPVGIGTIIAWLWNHQAKEFCKGFCPGYLAPIVTKTNVKAIIQTFRTTSTFCIGGCELETATETVTADPPPDSVVTETVTESTTTTTTLIAVPQVITSSEIVGVIFYIFE